MTRNEPAFPADYDMSDFTNKKPGLTKREYFAALAMQGILSGWPSIGVDQEVTTAILAVEHADALIEELRKEVE